MEKGAVPTNVKYNGKTCKECSICGYAATSTIVEKHFPGCLSKQVEHEYYHYCSQCSFAFVFEGTFKKHCKIKPACKNHKVMYLCRFCKRLFNEKKVFIVHNKNKSCFSKHAKDHPDNNIGTVHC